jgi:hypothetical protein
MLADARLVFIPRVTVHLHPVDHVDHCTRCGQRLTDMPHGDVLTEDPALVTCAPRKRCDS